MSFKSRHKVARPESVKTELLEMILLQAELLELAANPGKKATGFVVEAQLEPGMGPTANLLVQQGTLDEAIASFKQTIRLNPQHDPWSYILSREHQSGRAPVHQP